MKQSLFQVNGKPYFSIGGQANNSSGYDRERLQRVIMAAKAAHMNTVAVPVYWEILEKKKDFTIFPRQIW